MKLLAVYLLSALPTSIIQCMPHAGGGSHWAWREIEGKRCWYQGAPGKAKSLLQWGSTAKPQAAAPVAVAPAAPAKVAATGKTLPADVPKVAGEAKMDAVTARWPAYSMAAPKAYSVPQAVLLPAPLPPLPRPRPAAALALAATAESRSTLAISVVLITVLILGWWQAKRTMIINRW
jgi:hypothetical protein